MEETAFVKVKTQRNGEYLGTGEYGTCMLSEGGDFSRKQRGTEITGIERYCHWLPRLWNMNLRGVPCGLMVRIPGFHCHGLGPIPVWGTEILQAMQLSQKKKELLYINYGGTSENHPHSHANISFFHVLEHCRSSRDGGRHLEYKIYLEGRIDRN